ncbi:MULTISPECIES: 2Fe-2S iron-sulfur cluster-binding protein [Thermoactinomyces]|uniref:(2Fe-2S)-binding protein n=1 Tax=Thermoactinomyces daqus TaxID=1329516 RepID=A0A7W1X9M9_9BACL|nr:2Fe-2S iron-sulfur cluster-binding protein [Thermoactinomyces daqus]MBA4542602.1 (2Fe-2S)-binding protein [Thermoactinomyces daqus]MBH8602980.1 (2Fe-2S)-binding protein [Thermoactinomyces sp. CICC 10522]MBH8607172.1 (2Fe-2S)-binding protein [Thermoactinomyces sp. CICC 10521]
MEPEPEQQRIGYQIDRAIAVCHHRTRGDGFLSWEEELEELPRVKIELADQSYEFEVYDGANLLLEAASRSIPLPFQCTTGRCGTCRVHVQEGMENLSDYTDSELYRLGDEELVQGGRLACQLFVYGDVRISVNSEKSE